MQLNVTQPRDKAQLRRRFSYWACTQGLCCCLLCTQISAFIYIAWSLAVHKLMVSSGYLMLLPSWCFSWAILDKTKTVSVCKARLLPTGLYYNYLRYDSFDHDSLRWINHSIGLILWQPYLIEFGSLALLGTGHSLDFHGRDSIIVDFID